MTSLEFPLVDSSYDNEEILRCIEVLLSGKLTMGEKVREFEQSFARTIGAPHAIMVNSGSSANLLAMAAAVNPLARTPLRRGAHVAIPAVCWSTSLWPVVQMGLIPVLIDVEPETLNLSIESLERAVGSLPIEAVLGVHILGNSTEMHSLLDLCEQEGLMLIEDTCEALGSSFESRWLGTLGRFGTYSFYFSHHMTTIEGGMIVCQTEDDDDLLRTLRSHGWSREHRHREAFEEANPEIDPRFLFVNVGYNLRPTELQAAFGLQQIGRLEAMNETRKDNVARMRDAFEHHPLWDRQLSFPTSAAGLDPCWFGFPFLVSSEVRKSTGEISQDLIARGIDTRPIVSGNMALQPAIKHFNIALDLGPFSGAQQIHERGLFIGAHAKPLDQGRLDRLVDAVLDTLSS